MYRLVNSFKDAINRYNAEEPTGVLDFFEKEQAKIDYEPIEDVLGEVEVRLR